MSKKWLSVMVLAMFVLALGLAGCGGDKQQGKKVLKIGTDPGFAPFEFQDEKSKEYVGFDIDLIKALGTKMGYEVQIQNMNFDGLIPALEAGNIDATVAGMTIKEERAKKVLFSKPYYQSGLIVAVKNDNNTIKSVKDLEGKRIAVQIGTTGADAAKKIPNAVVREFNNAPEAFMELKAGGADAVINDKPVTAYYLKQGGDKDAKMVGDVLQAEEYGIAMNKKSTELKEKMDKALDEMKASGEYDKLYEKWFGKKQ
nr:basic amino acid ABC transporter substrate-binding protein [uncultured Anaeromusa sp.]